MKLRQHLRDAFLIAISSPLCHAVFAAGLAFSWVLL